MNRFYCAIANWISELKTGDYVVTVLCASAVCLLFAWLWRGGEADRVIIRANGEIVTVLPLRLNRSLQITGPLGQTLIEIRQGQARIASDPSPRQYCVRQGWLHQAGQVALCLPNRVSIEMSSRTAAYDSLAF